MQIKINNKWTRDDYDFYLMPSVTVTAANPKIERIDVPFSDGTLDLTNGLFYEDREINFSLLCGSMNRVDAQNSYDKFLNDCHGVLTKIKLPQWPEYYFWGRTIVGTFDFDPAGTIFEVSATVSPYRLKNELTTVATTVPNSGSVALNLKNERMTTLPEFTISASSQIIFADNTFAHNAGTFTLANIALKQGDNPITIKAVAGTSVKITYQEGAL